MDRRVLLDGVVLDGVAVLELLAGEDEALLGGGDALLVLDFSLHVFNAVACIDVEGNVLSDECLDEDLHSRK